MSSPLGFHAYVFIERRNACTAVLRPFPGEAIDAVRDAMADAGFELAVLSSGESFAQNPSGTSSGGPLGVYFSDQPFSDDHLGHIAKALTLRGIGAYAYYLTTGDTFSHNLSDITFYARSGEVFPRAGRRVILTHMWISGAEGAEGTAGAEATQSDKTLFFGAPSDLAEADILLASCLQTERVYDHAGVAAIEVTHKDSKGAHMTSAEVLSKVFATLGTSRFAGPVCVTKRRHLNDRNSAGATTSAA